MEEWQREGDIDRGVRAYANRVMKASRQYSIEEDGILSHTYRKNGGLFYS